MGRKKTHEQYVAEVAVINPNIEVVGVYVNNRTKITHRCKIDSNEWIAYPKNILKGCGCPICGSLSSANKRAKTHDQYVKEVVEINPDIEVVEEYIDDSTKILHRCKIDGFEWHVKPTNVLHGKGCPRCAGNERYGHDGYVKRVAEINPEIEVVGRYIKAKTKILHRCKIDGYEWYAIPYDILCGTGCPNCHTSKGEKIIAAWLDERNILYKPQETFDGCRDKRVLPFDFYLLDYNILIEYNGKQHYESIEYFGGEDKLAYITMHDAIKEDYCRNNNMPLIVIPYYTDIYEELEKMYESIIAKEVAA